MDIFGKRTQLNKIKAEAKLLTEQISNAERNCNHTFGKTEDDSFITSQPMLGTMRLDRENSRGSDPVFICDYGDVTKKRWKRTCSKCGKVTRTEKTKPTGQVADFD